MQIQNQSVKRGVPLIWWSFSLMAILVVVSIRIHLLRIPLERDEGEYAYAGQLLLEGIPPYRLAYNMKFPGVYAAYALVMSLFGQTSFGIHLGFLLVNLATVALIFFIAKRLVGLEGGIAAAMSYCILSVNSELLGTAAHATHFVMLPVLGGCLLLLKTDVSKRLIVASGILFGVGLLMKQPAIFFVGFGAVYLFFKDLWAKLPLSRTVLRLSIFLGSSFGVLGAACLWLWRVGVFDKFWFWTVTYAREYGTLVTLSLGASLFWGTMRNLFFFEWPFWGVAALGLIVTLTSKAFRSAAIFLLPFLGWSILALSSGLYFRNHYFIFVLPAFCLLIGVAVAASLCFCSQVRWAGEILPLLTIVAAGGYLIFADRNVLLAPDSLAAARAIYGTSPFPEVVRVGQYLREHCSPADKIAVLGSEPEIYFYSHRHSATGYIYTYAVMERQKFAAQMQSDMIHEIEAARPEYLVYVSDPASWLRSKQSPATIFEWLVAYTSTQFVTDGLVNMSSKGTDYYLPLPVDLSSIRPGGNYLIIFKRKPEE